MTTPDEATIATSSKPFSGSPVPAPRGVTYPQNSVALPRWALKGVFEKVFEELSADADLYVLIDGIVRLHQHGAGAKGGLRAKPSVVREGVQAARCVMVDALGNLVDFVLLPPT